MEADDVLRFLALARGSDLKVWIDGGWAVDALLGRQTRAHVDLDIALDAAEVPTLRNLLEREGFRELARPDSWTHNFVMEHPGGAVIDVHSFALHPDGSNRDGVAYRREHLRGKGQIGGLPVDCITPAFLVEFHTGYAVDETDWHDVKLLCAAFDLKIPSVFDRFRKCESNQADDEA